MTLTAFRRMYSKIRTKTKHGINMVKYEKKMPCASVIDNIAPVIYTIINVLVSIFNRTQI